ncbi:MAG: ammonium transporter [Betaproteobacteria bacterium]|nr:ammonium transporter [Betaproteobacteria bacterium]
MKRGILLLMFSLLWLIVPAMAEDKAETATAATEAQPVAAASTTEAQSTSQTLAAPVPNKGDTAWMITATALVIFMAIPGLALFYGGMVRTKNMLSMLMQVFATFSLLSVLWVVYGYSVAFTEGNAFFGGLSKMFLNGVTGESTAATFSKGVYIPEYIYIAFQLTFAAITPCLILGAFADRVKFSAVLLFMVLWFTFSYLPIAHMVWYWAGPDAYIDTKAAEAAGATAGWLFQKGALDFAGGTVVHINAGVAGLVGALLIGKRIGFGREAMAPHSLTMTMVGTAMLWFGWFGFNVGSNLEANGLAAMAFINTHAATSMAAVAWMVGEWIFRGKPTMLGAASGAVAGLVAITPACGFVGIKGALVIGLCAGLVCLWAVVWLKHKLGYDDSLDVFGVHCIGGILGALLTGVFVAPSLGGTGVYDYVANKVGDFDMGAQLKSQLTAVATSIVWSAVVSVISFKVVDAVVGLRISDEDERQGLDETQHGERAYNY